MQPPFTIRRFAAAPEWHPPKVSRVRLPLEPEEEHELVQAYRTAARHKDTLDNAIIRGQILVRMLEAGYDWGKMAARVTCSKANGYKLIAVATHPRMRRSDWCKSKYWSVDYEVLTWSDNMFEALVASGLMHSETSRHDINLFRKAYERRYRLRPQSDRINSQTPLADCTTHIGDALTELAKLPAHSVDCCVTSPPYYGVRDFKTIGQIGREATPSQYIERLVEVFREVHRVLRDDGTLWLVIGDTYSEKQMRGIPWRLAFALQDAGWILRQDIIWHKPTVTPERVRDRCTRAHDTIFLLTKRPRLYHYDQDAIAEPLRTRPHRAYGGGGKAALNTDRQDSDHPAFTIHDKYTQNRRDVWAIPTERNPELHFATFPTELARRCVLAGCPEGGTVLDPFAGTCTTGIAAITQGRNAVMIEMNPTYAAMMNGKLDRYIAKRE